MVYNYNNQQTSIPETELVQVSGGKVEFTYKFNYTKIENRNNITGFAYGKLLIMKAQYFLTQLHTIKISTSAGDFSAGGWLRTKM